MLGLSLLACSLGTGDEEPGVVLPPGGLPVSHPSKPLEEMKAAYDARDVSRYAAILDSGFTFVFPTTVVNDTLPENCTALPQAGFTRPAGASRVGVVPGSWDRARELDATANMFDVSFQDSLRCNVDAMSSLRLDFRTPLDRIPWVPYGGVKPTAADSLEEWLEAKIEFHLEARNQNLQVITNFMRFVIRPDSVTASVRWLVWQISEQTF